MKLKKTLITFFLIPITILTFSQQTEIVYLSGTDARKYIGLGILLH